MFIYNVKIISNNADVAESADAPDSGSGGGQHLVGSSPIIRTKKSRNPFGFWLFLYDDVELKPPQKRGPQKSQKGFLGKRSGNEAASAFYFNKMPFSGVCRDESPIIRTKCDC